MSADTSGRFAGKSAIVTGAASGIGAAIVERLWREGARVAACDRNDQGLAHLAGEVGIPSSDWYSDSVDVADPVALGRFVDASADVFGQIDVLVNNAGVGCFGHADEISIEAWRRTLSVNLDGVLYGSRAALPHLRASKGCIVNTASISGLFGDAGLLAYNVSKAGVVSLTKGMALDHAAEGVRVNCVCPGGVATPMLRSHVRDESIMAEYEQLVPLARLAAPAEIAAATAFLASDDASYITGVALVVDGGVTAKTGQPDFDRLYRARGWDQRLLGGS